MNVHTLGYEMFSSADVLHELYCIQVINISPEGLLSCVSFDTYQSNYFLLYPLWSVAICLHGMAKGWLGYWKGGHAVTKYGRKSGGPPPGNI